jgi:nucleoside-triphosphatase
MLRMLTGPPGIGKTTLVERVAAELADLRLGGFVTHEIREDGARVGFELVPFGERPRKMAHRDLVSDRRVGRYGVDVASVDYVADVALSDSIAPDLWIVDEIGPMEMLSTHFVSAMRRLLRDEHPLLATVALHGRLLDELTDQHDVEVTRVSTDNRDHLAAELVDWCRGAVRSSTQ